MHIQKDGNEYKKFLGAAQKELLAPPGYCEEAHCLVTCHPEAEEKAADSGAT